MSKAAGITETNVITKNTFKEQFYQDIRDFLNVEINEIFKSGVEQFVQDNKNEETIKNYLESDENPQLKKLLIVFNELMPEIRNELMPEIRVDPSKIAAKTEFFNSMLLPINNLLNKYNDNEAIADDVASELKDLHYKLGGAYNDKNDFDSAIKINEKILANYKDILSNSELLGVYNNLGLSNYITKNLDIAVGFYQDVLAAADESNQYHKAVISSKTNLGAIYRQKGLYDDSERELIELIKIQEEIHGDNLNHVSVADSYNNLGNLYNITNNHKKAFVNYTKATEIYKNIDPNNPRIDTIEKELQNIRPVVEMEKKEEIKAFEGWVTILEKLVPQIKRELSEFSEDNFSKLRLFTEKILKTTKERGTELNEKGLLAVGELSSLLGHYYLKFVQKGDKDSCEKVIEMFEDVNKYYENDINTALKKGDKKSEVLFESLDISRKLICLHMNKEVKVDEDFAKADSQFGNIKKIIGTIYDNPTLDIKVMIDNPNLDYLQILSMYIKYYTHAYKQEKENDHLVKGEKYFNIFETILVNLHLVLCNPKKLMEYVSSHVEKDYFSCSIGLLMKLTDSTEMLKFKDLVKEVQEEVQSDWNDLRQAAADSLKDAEELGQDSLEGVLTFIPAPKKEGDAQMAGSTSLVDPSGDSEG